MTALCRINSILILKLDAVHAGNFTIGTWKPSIQSVSVDSQRSGNEYKTQTNTMWG